MSRFMESCLPPVAHIVADLDEIEAEEARRLTLSDPARAMAASLGVRQSGELRHRNSAGVMGAAP